MKKLILSAAALSVITAPLAKAEIRVQTHTPSTSSAYSLTEDALPFTDGSAGVRPWFTAQYNLLDDPLVRLNTARTERSAVLIESIHTIDLGGGARIGDRASAAINIPLNMVNVNGMGTQFGLGDFRLGGKYRLTPVRALVSVSAYAELLLPTGDHGLHLSGGSFGAGAGFAAEHDFGNLRVAANLGYRNVPGSQLEKIDYRQQLPMALGAAYDLAPRWTINAEAAGALALPTSRVNNPGELYFGGRHQATEEVTFHAGIGIGSIGGTGSGDVRGMIGLRFTPSFDDGGIAATSAKAPASPRLARKSSSAKAPSRGGQSI